MVSGKELKVERIKVMVIGLPRRAISMVAEEVARQGDMELLGFTLGNERAMFNVNGIELVQIEPRFHGKKIAETRPDVAVDFTPRRETARFRSNMEMYDKYGISFVIGEDRACIAKKAKVPIAIVPNVRVESCYLILPLVIRAIKMLSKSKGGYRRVFHFMEDVIAAR